MPDYLIWLIACIGILGIEMLLSTYLAKKNNTLIIPNNLSDISGMAGSIMKIVQGTKNSSCKFSF